MSETKNEKQVSDAMARAHRERLIYLKKARNYMVKNDIPKAVKNYKDYLDTLATYYGVQEPQLNPSLFDQEDKNTISEMLLLSHAYWDMAKSYDRTKNLQSESLRCLNQFVLFTSGFKYQHINAQMVKKFIKRGRAHNLPAFQEVYDKIYVKPKGCYIVTHCHGDDHSITNELRFFRNNISRFEAGKRLIDFYYRFSPVLLKFFESRPVLNFFFVKIVKVPIYFVYLFSRGVFTRVNN